MARGSPSLRHVDNGWRLCCFYADSLHGNKLVIQRLRDVNGAEGAHVEIPCYGYHIFSNVHVAVFVYAI